MKYESRLARARSVLGESGFEAAWAEGKAMTPEEAVEYALTEEEYMLTATPPEETPADEQPPALTHRERQIAGLVAQGLTNRQVAAELGISERTAGNHVGRLLSKLGLRSRVQIATWAFEHRLPSPDSD